MTRETTPIGATRRTRAVLAISFALAAASPAAQAVVSFQGRFDLDVGPAPRAMAFLDSTDAVVVASGQGLTVLRRGADGFAAAYRLPMRRAIASLAVGRLTGSPHTDLAVVDTNELSIVPGIGAGAFGAPLPVASAARPVAVRARPLNRNGTLGLFVRSDAGIDVVLPSGARDVQTLPIPSLRFASDVDVADLNADGQPDLLAVNENDNRLIVLTGAGDGTFRPIDDLTTIRAPRRLIAADADGDGRPDAIVAGESGVAVHLRTAAAGSDGTDSPHPSAFGTPRWILSEPHLGGFAAGDINRDGHLDIAVVDSRRDALICLFGRGDGTFVPGNAYAVGRGPQEVLLTDLAQDGTLDALVLNHLGNSITVLRGSGNGAFAGTPILLGSARDATAATTADFNLDHHIDVAVASETSGTISVFLGDGRGHFVARPPVRAGHPRAMVAGPFGPDAAPGLAVADFGGNRVLLLHGDGQGGFAAPVVFAVGGGPTAIVSGSFRGHTDLAVANRNSDSVSVLYGDGRGGFSPAVTSPVGPQPNFLMVGDMNHDGAADLVVGNDESRTVTILHGSARGLGAPQTDQLADIARPLVAEDFDGDGHVDLVATNAGAGAIEVLPGAPSGGFGTRLTFPAGHHPSALTAGDFNEDGRLDLAVVHRDEGTVSILLNTSSAPAARPAAARTPKSARRPTGRTATHERRSR